MCHNRYLNTWSIHTSGMSQHQPLYTSLECHKCSKQLCNITWHPSVECQEQVCEHLVYSYSWNVATSIPVWNVRNVLTNFATSPDIPLWNIKNTCLNTRSSIVIGSTICITQLKSPAYLKTHVKIDNSPYKEGANGWGGAGKARFNVATPTYEARTRPLHVQHTYYRIIFKQNPFNIISRGVQRWTSTDFRLK